MAMLSQGLCRFGKESVSGEVRALAVCLSCLVLWVCACLPLNGISNTPRTGLCRGPSLGSRTTAGPKGGVWEVPWQLWADFGAWGRHVLRKTGQVLARLQRTQKAFNPSISEI